ncbi:uncharacterized protein PITG_21384 [Phytophthora infestans T30-4]|uniref:Uncharacterized protein n=1 Tax=Phytophthora infestans (strain T30-4) TaxID=403677 RepID=D0P3S3_PHYIT|nr:uncharacterized protein PITG_21384 [Phytophthora infestans T30-4]EEY61729.1 hypothetical protein PITG_21384 [Phytophthora infestans T30-4]|eukprot:XP_002895047.1 hypothetical protein PITG_21384 [Phytophthora infestans T30-4]
MASMKKDSGEFAKKLSYAEFSFAKFARMLEEKDDVFDDRGSSIFFMRAFQMRIEMCAYGREHDSTLCVLDVRSQALIGRLHDLAWPTPILVHVNNCRSMVINRLQPFRLLQEHLHPVLSVPNLRHQLHRCSFYPSGSSDFFGDA